jgi:hypothetical protein
MAYNREQFKNTIEEHIGVALFEFYKVKVSTKNRSVSTTADRIWKIRDRLETGLVVTLLHDIRGFNDRRRAIQEAVTEIKQGDEMYRRVAENMTFHKGKLRRPRTSVSEKDSAEFWALFDTAVKVGFQMADWNRRQRGRVSG